MSTDEIRDAFHHTFEPTMSAVTADPTLLTAVRRRHARRQRASTIGASLAVAALAAGALLGSTAIHARSVDSTTTAAADGAGSTGATQGASTVSTEPTSAPTRELQTVSMVDHELSLPSDWRLSGNRKLIDLDTIQPPEEIGGKAQYVSATSPDGTQQFEATVYSGPIAKTYRDINSVEDLPTFDQVLINGLPASFLISGPPDDCPMVDGPRQGPARVPLAEVEKLATNRPCPQDVLERAPYGEARYTFANGDFMSVDTHGMDAEALMDFLTTALTS